MTRSASWLSICVLGGFSVTSQIIVQTDSLSASPNPGTIDPAKSPRRTSINGWSSLGPAWDLVWALLDDGPNRHSGKSIGDGFHSQADSSRIQKVPGFACPFSPFDDSWAVGGFRPSSVQVTGKPDTLPLASGPIDREPETAESFRVPEPFPNPPSIGVFLPCAAADAAEVARLRLRVELPPVPAYPADGEIPEELQHRLVFLDEERGELVLAFPPNPDFEELQPRQEMHRNRVTDRVNLAIATCPSLSVAIYRPGDTRTRGHVYQYRLHNRDKARIAIGTWALPLRRSLATVPVFDLVPPYGWGAEDYPGSRYAGDRAALRSYSWGNEYRQKMRQSMIHRRIDYHAKLTALEPGNSLEPYRFTTEARPGIVRAYVVGSPSSIGFRRSWPGELRKQMMTFDCMEGSALSISTIGPKFPPDADRRLMASDFLDSLGELIRTGELPGKSTFIQEVLRRLETAADGDGGAVEPACWPSEPETEFQAEILMALRLSLGD